MNTLLQTDEFRAWLGELRDIRAKAVIFNRLDRASKGNFGDAKALEGGISEMRIDSGPGYRIYLVIGLVQPKKPNTDAHGFPRMNTDAPRPIRPVDPGSRGRRGDALGSVLGRPRDPRGRATRPRGGRVRRQVAAKTWPETSSVCIRVYPWNIFRTPWLQPLNGRLPLDFKASWSGGAKPIIRRIYFTRRGEIVYLLLVGGDKSTQAQDVHRAKALLKSLPKE